MDDNWKKNKCVGKKDGNKMRGFMLAEVDELKEKQDAKEE